MKVEKVLLVVSFIMILMIPVWLFAAVPEIKEVSGDYADVSEFLGKVALTDPDKETATVAIREVFTNNVVDVQGDVYVLEMKSYGEDLLTGESFWDTADTVSVDRKSGKLEDGSYLLFPHHLEKKNIERIKFYSYLPATTAYFEREETIQGLQTYVFSYDVTGTDLSVNYPLWTAKGESLLSHDSGMIWIEPVSGHIVRAETSWDVVLKSNPDKHIDTGTMWYSDDTIYTHVRHAQNEKRTVLLSEVLFPILLGLVALAFMTTIAIAAPKRKRRKK
jgi:hypothetical protein